MENWTKGVVALLGLIVFLYGGVKAFDVYHVRYALAEDVRLIQVREDLRDAKRHYYLVYELYEAKKSQKLRDELDSASYEVDRLRKLLDNLKSKK